MKTENSDLNAQTPAKYRLTELWKHPHGMVTFPKDTQFEEVPDVLDESSMCKAVRRIDSTSSAFHLVPKNLLKPI